MTIALLASRLRDGQLSPQEAVGSYLDRIEKIDRELNTYITVRAEEAMAEAAGLEGSRKRGPLYGVPLAVKDVMDVAGTTTTAASQVFTANVAVTDAAPVARLREAGAVILGKLNTHELAFGASSTSPHFGPVRNPWDLDRICGGSSGGSAAATAADLAAGTLGTDAGGSVRIPSAFCGVTGLRPTMGRISNKGVIPVAPWTFDQVGPVTRSAEDGALILDALVPGTKAAEALSGGLKGLRVGVVDALFASGIDSQVAATVRAAAEQLSAGGAKLMSIELPLLRSAIAIQQVMMLPEAASAHLNLLRTRFADIGADVRGRILAGLLLPGAAYVSGMRGRALYQEMLRQIFESCDLLVAPTMPSIAPRMDHQMVRIDDKEVPYPVSFPVFCHPWSVAGVPVVTVPCGFVDKMPVGMSLVGRHSEDAMVLRAAHGFQAMTDWHQKAPPV